MKELIGKYISTFPIGPFVSNSDGLTPVTNLTLSGADEKAIRKHNNVTPVSISANSWAAITSMDGHYNLTLTNSQMDTYGLARISIQDDSLCLPFFEDVAIVSSAFWHSKFNTVNLALANAVSSIAVEVDSIQAQVTSNYNRMANFPISGYLPSSETLNAHIVTLPTSGELNDHIITLPLSSHVANLPNSQTLNAHIITLPTSSVLDVQIGTLPVSGYVPSSGMVADLPNSLTVKAWIDTLPNSQELNAHIVTLPNSQVLNAHIVTLPTSQTLKAHIDTLPNSQAVGTIADKALADVNLDHLMKVVVTDSSDLTNEIADFSALSLLMAAGGNMSAFVSSDDSLQGIAEGAAAGGATQSEVQSACYTAMNDHNVVNVGSIDAQLDTFPTSQNLNAHMITLPTSQILNAHIITLPTSQELNEHIVTLPLSSHVADLPNSQTLNAHIITLPTSGELNDHIVTLPSSSALKGLIDTLPTSQTVMNAIGSGDVRVSSLFYTEIESGYPFIEKQRIDMAVFDGVTSGGGTSELHFRNVGNTKARLIVTVDSDGNRTAVNTLDGS